MTVVHVENLTKEFGDLGSDRIVAVDDLTLTIDDGELLVLLGPSGCGKTTTLRMIAGLEKPTEGRVEFDGADVTDIDARNRDVAMVFQNFALYPHMSVEDNLSFGLKHGGGDLTSEEIKELVRTTAEMLEIEDHLNKSPGDLSGGQQQRVALGRSIVREPRLFLFDEPLANLDAKLRKTMRTEIEELQNKVGTTTVYVTHNQEEAMSLGDRIAIFDGGVLQQCAPPETVFNEPANTFVADFVGSPSMNIVPVSVEQTDDYHFTNQSLEFSVPPGYIEKEVGSEATLGFRPQDVHLEELDPVGEPIVDAEVRVIEPLGTETVIHADGPLGRLTAQLNRSNHNLDLSVGDRLTFTIEARNVYLFDGETGDLLKPRQSTSQSVETREEPAN